MSRDYIIINGKNSLTITGLAIKTLPPISKPLMRTMREEIDGRDGDINTELGYQAYDKPLEVGLFGSYDINEIIAFFNSKGTIVFSDEPDKFYNFEILDKIDFTRLVKFRSAIVNIHCQPFKYPLTETPIEVAYEYVEGTGENITLDNTEASSLGLELKGNTSQQILPNEYTQVEYIQSDETNVINTSISPTSEVDIEVDIGNITTNNQFGSPAGYRNGNTNQIWWYVDPSQNNRINARWGDSSYTSNYYYTSGERIKVRQNKNGLYINGTLSTNAFTTATISGSYNIYLFACNNNNSSQWQVNAKIYEAKIWVSGTLKRHFIPCYRNNDNAVGMFDIVNGTFYSKQGNSEFIKGANAPTPNAPMPIEVVKGDNTITICGRNLFNKDTISERTYLQADGTLLTGTAVDYNTSDFIAVRPNTTYYKTETLSPRTKYYDRNKHPLNVTTYQDISIGGNAGSFTTPNNAYYLRMTINISTEQSKLDKVMLSLGSTRPTYEAYEGQSLPLYLGGNVFKLSEIEENKAIVGTTGVINPSSVSNISGYVPVIEGLTYRLTFDYTTLLNSTDRGICYYDSNKQFVNGGNLPMTNKNQTITIADGIRYIRFAYDKNLTDISLSTDDTPIEMASIPNTTYKDLFVKDNDIWYKRQVINKQIFNGDSSMLWGVNSNWDTTAPALLHIFTNSLNNLWKKGQSGFLSNRFTCTTEAQRDFAKEMVTCHTTNTTPYFFIKFDRLTGVTSTSSVAEKITAFNNWLINNNTELLYLAAEETNIEITNETLIDQLEAIKNAISYNGQTNISQTNNNKPFIISASALKKGSDMALVNNQGNIYSKPTIELEGTGVVNIYKDGSQAFEVDLTEENNITIDTEQMEAYTPNNTLANRKVTGDYSKFKIEAGENEVKFDGALTSATITNYKRWL